MKKYISVKVRHILCEEQGKVERAMHELKEKKRPFNKVAEEYSEDKARAGGSLGWIKRDGVIKEFGDAAFQLEPSTCKTPKVTDPPIKTNFGYHIIMIEERK